MPIRGSTSDKLPSSIETSSVDFLMSGQNAEMVREESLWFGDADRLLFGRLTIPPNGQIRGAVLLAPPIGREVRPARETLRELAIALTRDGFASLRYDHFGCGDSSGSLDDDFDDAWSDGVAEGVALLRSLGAIEISAVGMRMGAPILVKAVERHELGLNSVVFWDPCETGRSFAREMEALGALQKHEFVSDVAEDTKLIEYPLSEAAMDVLKTYKINQSMNGALATRLLVVVRDDRAVSSAFRDSWDAQGAQWFESTEQSSMFENPLPRAVTPVETIEVVRAWLVSPPSDSIALSAPSASPVATLHRNVGSVAVRERIVDLGPRHMFGVLCEPVGEARGPLMVFVNGVNEDHLGPARLWVDLSRQWAESGLRSIRFDLGGLGESARIPALSDRPIFDRSLVDDVAVAVRTLDSANASDSVLIGYCSGALLSYRAASMLDSRGVCGISPELVAKVFRNVSRVKNSPRGPIKQLVSEFEGFLKRHRLEAKVTGRLSRLVRSFAFPPRVPPSLAKSRTQVLVLLAREDLPNFSRLPVLGRRLITSGHQRVEIVPGMDHNLLNITGRERAVDVLDRYVRETFPALVDSAI